MKYAYYPGCSAESTARDQHTSVVAVAEALGLELVEPKGWTCCGSTPAHQTDQALAVSLAAANLIKVKEMKLDMVVTCASCYSRMKAANHEIAKSPEMRQKVAEALGQDYDGSVRVRHIVEVLLEDVGMETMKNSFTHTLGGLGVASYYGCLLVRPPEVTQFDDPENPVTMDRLVDLMGGESVDWPHKVECCGAALSLTRTDVVVKLSDSILGMAADAGAKCVAVACPMCQMNLDLRQQDMAKVTGRQHNMPILYITQLLGLCLGISHKELGLKRLMVAPEAVVEAVAAV
ncbi:MAG: heterodisulfide reductase subunit B [bacterium]|nr:heterodisulfide reductase subunit B [bacterium]